MSARLAAFDFITGCLSIRCDSDVQEDLRSLTLAEPRYWDAILDVAQTQGIAPALWVSIRNRELVGHLPPKARNELFRLHFLNTLKNQGLREQAIGVVREMNSIGVEPILLKGGASLFVETFDDPGSRVMTDLDILVPPHAAEDCWSTLLNSGYYPMADHPQYHVDYRDSHHHLRPLFHPSGHGRIEIHRDALPNGAARILPTSILREHCEPVPNSLGIRMSVPSPTHRILHNLLHSALVNKAYARGRIPLRSLHELAMMQAAYRDRIDWVTIRHLMRQGGQMHLLRGSIYLAHRLLGCPLPDPIPATRRAKIHHARTRLQLRWLWLDELLERSFWFSSEEICQRYRCDSKFWPVNRRRVELAASLASKALTHVSRADGA